WVCEKIAGESMQTLMSRVLWSRLGAEQDALIATDQYGVGMFDGGINTTLRDLARFGFVYANRGRSLTGQQVAPTTWIGDTLTTSEDVRQAFADGPGDNRMPGGAYHNQFWFPFPDSHAFLALGIHGQMIYMNPGANVVGVKLSSWGLPQDAARRFPTMRALGGLAMAVNSPAKSPPVSSTITPPFASQRPASAIVPRRWQLLQSLSHHVPVLPHPPGAVLGHASGGACRPAGEGTARWARPLHGRRGRSRTRTCAQIATSVAGPAHRTANAGNRPWQTRCAETTFVIASRRRRETMTPNRRTTRMPRLLTAAAGTALALSLSGCGLLGGG